jgi:hypothetical protein
VCFPNRPRHFQAVFPRILHPSVRQIQGTPPGHLQDARCLFRLTRTIRSRAPGTHFTAGEIQNTGTTAALGHFEQGAAAGLFHIVPMGGNGQNIKG